jgi:hypothetical protein
VRPVVANDWRGACLAFGVWSVVSERKPKKGLRRRGRLRLRHFPLDQSRAERRSDRKDESFFKPRHHDEKSKIPDERLRTYFC